MEKPNKGKTYKMRNLKLLDSVHCHQDQAQNSRCISIDCDTGHIYCATNKELLGLDPSSAEVTAVVSLVDDDYLPADGSAHVVAVQYLLDQQALCAATSNGNLLLWNVTFAQLECVGSVDSGITGMQWSPDLELLILTTGAGTLIMMTREFDPITETSLYPDQFGEAEFVQVGWGKKETQFHGSEGKSAATKKSEEVKPVQEWDDRVPRITWRGDGQYFAISTVGTDKGIRKVRVWTRDCCHHSTSENVDGIEQALSWKPSGSLLATSQRRPNKHDIAFFEKNGLRHGEFTLPFGVKDVKVCEVLWNLDSTVLAVWAEDLDDGERTPRKAYVQLWTTGNYHWYLKQSLLFDGPEHRIATVQWDPEHAYRLHIMCSSGQYYQYTWAWATSNSVGRTSDDQALVAVIDGAKVLMTPMRNMVVPPPMSAYQLQLPCAVNQVVFAPSPDCNDVLAVLDDRRVAVFKFRGENKDDSCIKLDGAGGTGFSKCCKLPSLVGIYSIHGLPENRSYPLSMSHFTWVRNDVIIFCTVTMTTIQHSVLHIATIEDNKLKIKSSIDVSGLVYGIASDPDSGGIAVQLVDGTILKLDAVNDLLFPLETEAVTQLRFPVPCTQMAVCEVGNESVVLGLTDRYRFYVNDTEVASNCTSFSVHDEFLLLTTLTHTCRCICRRTKVKVLPSLSDGKAHPFDESIRRVERGSRIVTSVADDTKLVLQMPRGNLETIHPRALVLSAVRKHLDHLNYKEAFMMMRKHRINMNLIYDHSPDVFLSNVEKFVCQVEAANHINLFLTDLLEEDVTATMYTAVYQREATPNTGSSTSNKVDKICDAVRKALYSIDENKYLLSILTTYVRKSKPELEQALHLVKKLRDSENESPHINAEEVLKYLLFLVDVNEMYDIALGTYDFDLVMMVAEKSQKDPKEYIPFLNELRRLETNYQRYTIDRHLKRYSKALANITKCGQSHFQECLTLITEHHLHTEALQLYAPSSSEFMEIARSFGDLLSSKKQHEDAAIMYMKGKSWEQALKSYMACSQWQQVFCMTAQLQYSAEQESETARTVAEELKLRRRHSEAATVLEQYAKDIEEAIVTLIYGAVWEEALRLMYKYKRTDFIETDLKSQLMESFDHHMVTMETLRQEFEKYKTRLGVVRQEKEKARIELLESGGVTNDADADLFSDTSSATGESIQSSRYSAETSQSSVYSKMSGRSVKNQRKATHKKWKLKEGSQYEDYALIAALAKTVTYIDSLRDEMRSLIRVLVQFNYDKKAKELQHTYDSFLSLIDKSLPQIWLEEETDTEFKPILGPTATANTIALAMQQGRSLQSESEEKLDPVIRTAPVLKKEVRWKLYALES